MGTGGTTQLSPLDIVSDAVAPSKLYRRQEHFRDGETYARLVPPPALQQFKRHRGRCLPIALHLTARVLGTSSRAIPLPNQLHPSGLLLGRDMRVKPSAY